MNHSKRAFPELTHRLGLLTAGTRTKLSGSLVRALRSRRVFARTMLNGAVAAGCHELRAAGMDDDAITGFFGALVEETGRACGADRPSLVSGQLRWVPVRGRVLELVSAALHVVPAEAFVAVNRGARAELFVAMNHGVPAEPFFAMDQANGPR